jgi:Amt family ammonium transporter
VKKAWIAILLTVMLCVTWGVAQESATAGQAGGSASTAVEGTAQAAAPVAAPAERPVPAAPTSLEETIATTIAKTENAAADELEAPDYAKDFVGVNFTFTNIWMIISALLVFIMGLGFALVESGLTRARNTTNILFKNLVTPAIGVTTYAIMGFNIMYPGETAWIINKVLGFGGFGLPGVGGLPGAISEVENAAKFTAAYNPSYTYLTDFLFQSMFAATAATIVSGAVAERIKLSGYIIFTVIYVALVYPFVGSWVWGGGWLDGMGFHDLAGSTLVHSVGGWAALAGAIVLGPRFGRYAAGKVKAMPGHNLTFATIGVFILWFGWWGFNGGSALSSSPKDVIWILVTTNLACVCGILGAMATSWFVQKKPDLTMVLNGALAGLVAITAPADVVSMGAAAVIGFIGGVIVVFSVFFFDRVKVDDPVGAISVHLVNGVWGTLAVGIFGGADYSVVTQLIGVLAYGAVCFPAAFLIFFAIKKTVGLRVSDREELRGLDIGEHGQEAYSGFQIFTDM